MKKVAKKINNAMQDDLCLNDPLTLALILNETNHKHFYETVFIQKSSLDQSVSKVNRRKQVMAIQRRLLLFLLIALFTVSISLT